MADNNNPLAGGVNKEEQAEQLRYVYNLYAQRYEALLNEISLYAQAQAILLRNVDLLENIQKIENSNTMLALEGGIYLDGKLGNIKTVLAYVGAGYILEKNVADAKTFFSKNEQEERTVMQKLNEEKQKLEKELLEITYNMQALGQG